MTGFVSVTTTVRAALDAAPALVGVKLQGGGRVRPATEGETRCVVVKLDRSQTQAASIANGPQDWTTTVALDCMARATPAQEPETVVDALLTTVYQAVMGISASALASAGITAVGLTQEVDWQPSDADPDLITATLYLDIVHRTAGTSLDPI